MVLQTGIIVFLAFWVYQEYLYNQYLQDYVNSYFQGSGLLVVILGSVGIFVIVGLGLYWKLIRAGRGLESSERVSDEKNHTARTNRILEPHVEQNLTEMLRRIIPAETSTAHPGPVSDREDHQALGGQPE